MGLLLRNDKRHIVGVYLSSSERVESKFCQLIKMVRDIVNFKKM
jgi:hypothetical protein